jgi:cellulose synthase/poly-beta-1,6-N-acetylglucosamine synthase-like glycosyltransferase
MYIPHCSMSLSLLLLFFLSLYLPSILAGTFTPSRKSVYYAIFAMSILLCTSSSATTCPRGWISVILYIGDFYGYMSRICRFVSNRGKNSWHSTWRPKYISFLPATMNRHKWNGKRLLGWPMRDKQSGVKHTFSVLFLLNVLLHSFSFSPLSHTLCGLGSSVGIATGYRLDGPGIEFR